MGNRNQFKIIARGNDRSHSSNRYGRSASRSPQRLKTSIVACMHSHVQSTNTRLGTRTLLMGYGEWQIGRRRWPSHKIQSGPIYPSSTPPTRTDILRGKGDTSEFVIGGTAPRPFSDEVCVSIARKLLDNVAARFLLNCCRSGWTVMI